MDAPYYNGDDEREFSAPPDEPGPRCGDPACDAEPDQPCLRTCRCEWCLRHRPQIDAQEQQTA